MVHSLDVLQRELQALALELEQMPPTPDTTRNWWGTRLNRLFDLYTLASVVHAHPHMDKIHLPEAATVLAHVRDRLIDTDRAYHRHCTPSPLPLAGGDRGRYLVTHLCPARQLHDTPCGTFATLDHALIATGHHDPALWTPTGDHNDQLVIDVAHRRAWLPVSQWTIHGATVAAALRERVTENVGT